MRRLQALEFASTIRHDGHGGVADDLDTVQGTVRWLRDQSELLAGHLAVEDLEVDEELRAGVVELRRAVRALFARVVSPGPPSRADAHRLMPADRALAHLNATAAMERVTPQLVWPDGADPSVRLLSDEPEPRIRLLGALARSAIDFLSGPEVRQLRACTAPRCVRYFVKAHGRQEWCKPSCGNRARAARHYRRQQDDAVRD
ncbi:CGNR zinc finger domain-containing protein [Streptomyces sp. NEAU-Y11]|uniref:CGNR zinc finger domain-containing protein n=1 Tax=Streptomyces cucumeris TaxID=2962890 RepID=UPI0020C8E0B0|nr:ABATE domain-containing protein [Streptomyces sp. NEAU-Y11]MCP9211764.1 ABATE domain-containing protein [Streptomyces sp. NEAU-Y11]